MKRDVLVMAGLWVIGAFGTLVATAIVNNGWRIWDTAAFCGSYADFFEPPVPEVCLSFPHYLQLSLTHPPYVIRAILVGSLMALLYYHRERFFAAPDYETRDLEED